MADSHLLFDDLFTVSDVNKNYDRGQSTSHLLLKRKAHSIRWMQSPGSLGSRRTTT